MTAIPMKPQQWGVNRGLVAPESQWAWDGLVTALPQMEGGGNPRNVGHYPQPFNVNGGTWKPTCAGLGLDFPGGHTVGLQSNSQITFGDLGINLGAGGAGTVFAFLERDQFVTDVYLLGSRDSLGGGMSARILSTELLRFTLYGVADYSSTVGMAIPSPSNRPFSVAFAWTMNDSVSFYSEGHPLGNPVNIVTGTHAAEFIGAWCFYDANDARLETAIDGRGIVLLVYDRRLSDQEIAALHLDPFKPFRMADEAIYKSLAAHVKALLDSIAIADSIANAVGQSRADSLAIGDSEAKAIAQTRADAVAIAEDIVKGAAQAQADSVGIVDSDTKVIGQPQADTITIADAIAKTVGKIRIDTITIADTFSRVVTWVRALADTIGITDVIAGVGAAPVAWAKALADTITISDNIYGIIRLRTRLRRAVSRMVIQRMNVSRLPLVRYILRRFP